MTQLTELLLKNGVYETGTVTKKELSLERLNWEVTRISKEVSGKK
jgi:hypothetical protein